MSGIKNEKELDALIMDALGTEGTQEQLRHVRLLCKDLMREVVDECRAKSQAATNAITEVLKPE